MAALDQIGTMLSPCSPRIKALTCDGAALKCWRSGYESESYRAACPGRSPAPAEVKPIGGEYSQNIDGIADDENDAFF